MTVIKSSYVTTGLLLILLMTLLMTACGDNNSATPSSSVVGIAANTTTAVNTPAIAATTVVANTPTIAATVALNTVAATTGSKVTATSTIVANTPSLAATTALNTTMATSDSKVTEGTNSSSNMAVYPNATPVDLPVAAQQGISAATGDLKINQAKYQTFTVTKNPDDIAAFYAADWQKQGFNQEMRVKTGSPSTTVLREVYHKDNRNLAILAIGPLDKYYLQHVNVNLDIPGLKDIQTKLKVGDTIFVLVTGTK